MNDATTLTKPTLDLTSIDGNAFSIMGAVRKALKRAGYPDEKIEEYSKEAQSGDYDNLVQVSLNWVEQP